MQTVQRFNYSLREEMFTRVDTTVALKQFIGMTSCRDGGVEHYGQLAARITNETINYSLYNCIRED